MHYNFAQMNPQEEQTKIQEPSDVVSKGKAPRVRQKVPIGTNIDVHLLTF
jgi:hypothetical protein